MVPNGRFVSAFVKPDGPQIDRGARMFPDFNLKDEILSGLVKVLTETDFAEWNNREASRHTSYFYNTFLGNWSVTTKIASLRIQSKSGVWRIPNAL